MASTLIVYLTLLIGYVRGFNDIAAFRRVQQYQDETNRALAGCSFESGCISDQIAKGVFKAIRSLPQTTVDSVFNSFLGNQDLSGASKMLNEALLHNLRGRFGDQISEFDKTLQLVFNTNATQYYASLMASKSFREIGASILGQLRQEAGIEDENAEEFWQSVNTLRSYNGEEVRQALTDFTNKTIDSLSPSNQAEYCESLIDSMRPGVEGPGFESLLHLLEGVCERVKESEERSERRKRSVVARGYTPKGAKCGTKRATAVTKNIQTTLSSLRVFGGNMAAKAEFKFLASIVFNGGVICTGTVIDATHVMTAAHCTIGARASQLKVSVGEYDVGKKDGEVTIQVKSIINHPLYNDNTIENDISILTLGRSVSGLNNVEAICLPRTAHCSKMNMRKCVVAGWGGIRFQNGQLVYPRNPYEGSVLAYHGYYCPKRNPAPSNKTTQMCAIGAADTCNGDSGGPLFCPWNGEWTQCGITSYGPADCNARGTNGVYTHVRRYKEWIEEVVGPAQGV